MAAAFSSSVAGRRGATAVPQVRENPYIFANLRHDLARMSGSSLSGPDGLTLPPCNTTLSLEMSSIRILPEEISNRIAAGEVVERPASVVKELVENAIDAAATQIRVETQLGGRRLIQVTDNGCGMDADDALLCLEAHATSKIVELYDIDRIQTLGFRGEALPSIAAVSRFDLQTRQADAVAGTAVRVEGGVLRGVEECGCAPGTSVTVRNLFFNLPARRKFLRQPATEDQHIQDMVLLHALGHPDRAFELVMNGQRVLQVTAGTDIGTRIAMLLGRDVFAAMIPVEYSESGIDIHGFVARPGMTRSNRREQRTFVNGRPAEADALYFGIRDAYHTLVLKGRYPPVVLFITLPADQVDVNVHPTKREVRFRDNRLVGQVVAAAVRHALRALASGVQDLPRPPDARPQPERIIAPPVQVPLTSWPAAAPARPAAPLPTWEIPAATPHAELAPAPSGPALPATGAAVPAGPSPSAATRPEIQQLRVIGVFANLYLVAESPAGLVLIDQHAAHERVLFEKLLASARSEDGASQPLLLPVTVELAPADAALLRRSQEYFVRVGFRLDPFGGNTFLITAIPPHFPQENLAGMLRDILDELQENPAGSPRPDEVRVAQAACKHAVRSEDSLTQAEVQKLLEALAETEMPYTCPHGRPVMINIPHAELEKRFGRRK
jgi:DNA mismatch repair protein MutL